jgi:hypothetical protein
MSTGRVMPSEILEGESNALVQRAITPMSILEIAVSQGADMEKLTKLMELQARWEAIQARKAYVQAMSEFKNEPIVITKDKENKQYGSWYSSIGNLVNTVTPFLSKHGLSAEWELDQSEGIRVGCKITHSLGHSGETKWMKVPPDTSGAKNPLQQIKSAVTYAKISTFEMATGLASTEGNLDDDGNDAGDKKPANRVAAELVAERLDWIENCRDLSELQRTFTNAYKMAQQVGDKEFEGRLIKAKDARKEALRAGH